MLKLALPSAAADGSAEATLNSELLSAGAVHSEGFYLPRGLEINAELRTPIDTRISQVGDLITVQTMTDLFLGDYNVIPANSFLHGHISRIKKPGKMFKNSDAEVSFDRISIKGDGVNPSRNVFINGKLSVKEFGSKSHNVNDGQLYKSRAMKAAGAGALVGGGTTGAIAGLTHLYEGFGTSGMMVARAATLFGAGLGAFAGASLIQKDDKRLDPGTEVLITLDEPSLDVGENRNYENHYSVGAPLRAEGGKTTDKVIAANANSAEDIDKITAEVINELEEIDIGVAYDRFGGKLHAESL